jgi:hypothetical protein
MGEAKRGDQDNGEEQYGQPQKFFHGPSIARQVLYVKRQHSPRGVVL